MFVINEDNSIYVTRGDVLLFSVKASNDGNPYTFKLGDVVRLSVVEKKAYENVVLQKDFPITTDTDTVQIVLEEQDTKIGETISKPKDYWYEIVLNPDTEPQTIVGYDEDGAKVFKLFPEGEDLPETPITEEDIPIIDAELNLLSSRPVENRAVAREIIRIDNTIEKSNETIDASIKNINYQVTEQYREIAIERARITNLATLSSGSTTGDAELIDARVGVNGVTYANLGESVRTQLSDLKSISSKRVNLLNNKTDVDVFHITDLPIEKANHYVAPNGEMKSANGYNVRKITFDESCFYAKFIIEKALVINGYLFNGDGSVSRAIINTDNYNGLIMCESGAYALVTEQVGVSDGVQYVVINHYNGLSDDGYIHECMYERLIGFNMYVNNEGEEKALFNSCVYKIPIIEGVDYFVNPTIDFLGSFYDDKDTHISGITLNPGTNQINIPENASYMKFNACIYNSEHPNVVYKFPKVYKTIKDIPTYSHSVEKPVVFSGKKIVSFGDSITFGATPYTKPTKTTPYIELFAKKHNAILDNRASSGTFICDTETEISITNKILSYSGDADIIFIAGGCNDYNFNKPLGAYGDVSGTTFYGCLHLICDHLIKKCPNAKIYFITPINQSVGVTGGGTQNIIHYRNAIFEVATSFGFNVVDGSQMGFPTIYGSRALRNAMITDGVHPTEVGHKMYARTLSGVIV